VNRLRSSSVLLPALLSGCVVGPDFVRPAVPSAASYAPQPGTFANRMNDGAVDTLWWRSFKDDQLTALVERLAGENLDVQAAAERVLQARAQRRVTASDGLPRLDGSAAYTRQRQSPNSPLLNNTVPSSRAQLEYDDYRPQLQASWEVDLFGRVRRSVEAADAATQARVEDRRAISLSAAAELAQNYFLLRESQLQEEVARRNIAAVQRRSILVRQLRAEGAVSALDVEQTDAQLSTVQQSLPDLIERQARLKNAIGLLLALPPRALEGELEMQRGRQAPVPPVVPVGLPSELARRRPDVRAAEALLHAATARTGIAIASFYPSFGLTGSGGYDSLSRGNLFNWASRFLSLGAVFSLPIFHGGELKGQLELRRSEQREAALNYRKVVLQAWTDVDDALTAYAQAQQLQKDATATSAANERALVLAEQRYQEGASAYLDVISTQTAVLGGQEQVVRTNARVETTLTILYRALGGGWEGLPDAAATSDAFTSSASKE
jgi:NodT family efflux transporter outer membrane factor (OMF) lipoprotein